jgi:hypothetical protein
VKSLNGFFGFLLVLGLLAGCDLQVPESVPTRISEVRPERPTDEQPVPEAPAPEQPAPEQPTPEQPAPEQPAPEQPTAPPAPLQPIPPTPPADNRLIDTLLIVLTLAIIVVAFFLGRAIGRDRQRRRAAEAAAPASPATIQNTFNAAPLPPTYEPPPPVAPPPSATIRPEPIGDAQSRFVYYPGTDTIPVPDTPPIYDRSYAITIDLVRNSDAEEGVLLALGSMQAGYAMYVLQGRLIYTLALAAVTKQIVASAALPLGEVRIRYEFNRTGAFRGTGALFINEHLVGAQIFPQTIPLPPAEGLDIGIDRGIPVTTDYPAPFPYQGTIRSVVYELTFDSTADQA